MAWRCWTSGFGRRRGFCERSRVLYGSPALRHGCQAQRAVQSVLSPGVLVGALSGAGKPLGRKSEFHKSREVPEWNGDCIHGELSPLVLRVLDLFSGIGGFSLGLERAGGFRTVAFCEIEPFSRAVLAKHWPGVPIHGDVRELRGCDVGPVEVICGGFPCQDISVAGKGAGLAGERSGLWGEFSRLIGEVRPFYVIVENVSALLGRGFGDVLGDLAALGYDAEWHCIQAANVGAAHIRDRVWILAYPGGERRRQQTEEPIFPRRTAVEFCPWWSVEPDVGRVAYGVPSQLDRGKGLGNAVVPQIPELIGRAILSAESDRPEKKD